ncbi:hypothetical protein HAZT_HAZT007594, partial [Hyalella azteca]
MVHDKPIRRSPLVVRQEYDTDVNKGYVIRGNAALLRCEVPSFVGDLVHVTAWQEEATGHHYYPNDDYGSKPACTGHHYYPNDDYGSKPACTGHHYYPNDDYGSGPAFKPGAVIQQEYRAEVNNEFVIVGNAGVMKCVIPTFTGDYVSVTAWDEETNGVTILPTSHYGTSDGEYVAEAGNRYVIRGNAALFRIQMRGSILRGGLGA